MIINQSCCAPEPDCCGAVAADDDQQLESYATAKRLKHPRYRGSPCRSCGNTVRRTSSGACWPCELEQQRARHRADPERLRRYHRERGQRPEIKAKMKAYNEAERERIRACSTPRPEGLVIARAAAIEAGYTTYYLGPCRHGHTCGRRHDGNCISCQRAYYQARPGRTDEERARDAARREAKAAERAQARLAAKQARTVAREQARQAKAAERVARPRYEPRRASPKLTDAEREAIERAKAERRAARERAKAEQERAERERLARVEQARAQQARERELAAERAEALERARREVAQRVEEAKEAGKRHKRLAGVERKLAAAKLAASRRATGEAAPTKFSGDEAASIEAALVV
jgi:hypothetical protein